MTVSTAPTAPSQRPFTGFGPVLRGEPGDTLVIDGEHVSGLPRTGTIIAVAGRDGRPLCTWAAGGR